MTSSGVYSGQWQTPMSRFERLFFPSHSRGLAIQVDDDHPGNPRRAWRPRSFLDRDLLMVVVGSRMAMVLMDASAVTCALLAGMLLWLSMPLFAAFSGATAVMMLTGRRGASDRAMVHELLLGWYNSTHSLGVPGGLPVFVAKEKAATALRVALDAPVHARWHIGGAETALLDVENTYLNFHTIYVVRKAVERNGVVHIYIRYIALATADGQLRFFKALP